MKVGFVGQGKMGVPMTLNLIWDGHEVTVFNRTREKTQAAAEEGARVVESPAQAADGADVVVTILSDDAAVEAVVFAEDGVLGGLGKGAVHASMSTIGVATTRRLAEAHQAAGQGFVAAPVFGRPEAAEASKLWVVAAGPADMVERCQPVFAAVGYGVSKVGEDATRAAVLKLASNFVLASAIEALAEAIALVRKHGIDPRELLDVVNTRVIRSPFYENYGTIITDERYEPAGFSLELGLKDVTLALRAAEESGASLPLAALVRDRFQTAVSRGWGEIDWAGLGRVSSDAAGLGSARGAD
ncbi:MAG: NAD(P)-dependent oxidoreductase [Gemmatimonadota bacterium]|nr:MAG: NAD(P)-dependent oxidoreductase [Gemmatimonadota bacterium]